MRRVATVDVRCGDKTVPVAGSWNVVSERSCRVCVNLSREQAQALSKAIGGTAGVCELEPYCTRLPWAWAGKLDRARVRQILEAEEAACER